jgi:hypothetical protein
VLFGGRFLGLSHGSQLGRLCFETSIGCLPIGATDFFVDREILHRRSQARLREDSFICDLEDSRFLLACDGEGLRFFIRGGFAEITSGKITILAEEAIPMADVDVALLDQRIKDAEEDIAAAKTDDQKARATESLDDLKQVRAAF